MKSERYLSQQDATILSHLAQHLLRTGGPCVQHAEQLIAIIETSILLPVNATRNDYVALYSTVVCRDLESNQHMSICIVCPREVHDGLERVSILAPLALSLVGRIVGSLVDVTLPFVRPMYVEITEIEHSAPVSRPAIGRD